MLAAGLARNCDTHDLSRQRWRLLLPFAVSTLAAAVLFVVMIIVGTRGDPTLSRGVGLLGLFWLTAPFAFLYGLPFERLWPVTEAAQARRWTVAVVAACRVTLMARCVSVLLSCGWWEGLLLVAGFAVPVGLVAVGVAFLLVQKPEDERVRHQGPGHAGVAGATRRVVDAMGMVIPEDLEERIVIVEEKGKRSALAKLDALINGVCYFLGCAVMVVGVIAALVHDALRTSPRHWRLDQLGNAAVLPAPALWLAVSLAVVFWIPWLALRQPAQQRRTKFVQRLRFDPLPEVMRDLAALRPGDFPARWNPAAALASPELASRMLEATQIAAKLPAGSWIRACFLSRLGQTLPIWLDSWGLWLDPGHPMPEDQLRELASLEELLRQLPEAQEILKPHQDYLEKLCADTQERDPPRHAILESLAVLALKRGSQSRDHQRLPEKIGSAASGPAE